ncbi:MULTISPECIES: sensor histidine kinase [unclassified Streptomyces]|uniref:sensor histidine kinase n=1 Tax=unclassified Streptomyces TaxID=2593676 RepID=UPI0005ECD5E2|nr:MULTISPECIES: histidine kinase [unclassified Streptomyces]APU38854.1 ATP-binding protein [Streptomyces sp. TN58]KJK47701.1 histidine kinase [Streptomyces sp. NRRL F-4428]
MELITAAIAACLSAAAAGVLGMALLRARRGHRAALEERGWLLERERESAARSAVDAERARIAAELHDIVSHNVSLMVVQAGAAREVLTTLPEEAAAAMAAVEQAGRNTMTELRHLLGLLAPAQDGADAPYEAQVAAATRLSPQPSLARLSALVDRFAFAGLPVEVRMSGDPRPLPAGIDVTAYRIIQEALTNALKHGEGGRTQVSVRYAEHALRVEVLSGGASVLGGGAAGPRQGPADGAGPKAEGTGRGLIGLRERVAVYGGDLDARRRLGGGYRVRARLPLDRP